jgi:2'-5' RNA ligase
MTGPRLANHWVELAEWAGGRELWAFYLTFREQPLLHGFVQRQQRLLDGLGGLDLVAPDWLHLTVQGVVFADAVDAASIARLRVAGARAVAEEGPLSLVVHRPVTDRDAIILPVGDADQGLTRLRLGVRRAACEALRRSDLYELPEPVGGFAPHITVAYARADAPELAAIEARLSRAEETELRLSATYVSLLRLNRGTSRWWWSEELQLPLQEQRARALSQ